MKTIPVPVPEVLNALNLPEDMARNPVFPEHEPHVLAQLERYLEPDAYAALAGTGEEPSETLAVNARLAYCFLILASTLEFLNLKTVGQGIVKVIGLDATETALLTGEEIAAFQKRLLNRALAPLTPWLSPEGHEAYARSFPVASGRLRISVI